jgi:hypothetical protein
LRRRAGVAYHGVVRRERSERVKLSRKVSGRASIMGEFVAFLWERKLWWMIPMVSVLLLFGTLMVLAQGTALSPFIYTLF